MRVLFIGGTGIISAACSRLAVSRGIDLYHLNRGVSAVKRPVEGVTALTADIRDEDAAARALGTLEFDAVVDFVAFEAKHVRQDIRLFRDRTRQYVFISSASIYQTPPESWPVTEDTPLSNPVWQYSRDKILCETILREAHAAEGFPAVIVRPSHTYDETLVPLEGGPTVLDRMKRGKPIVIHGDGSSLWTLTHNTDFAVGLVGLLGRDEAIGEAYHVTSDEWLSWDRIARILAGHLGVEPRIVHVSSDVIARYDRRMGDSLLGDKTHSMIFDNAKIKALVPDFGAEVPFAEGARGIVAWHEADPARMEADPVTDALFDRIVKDYS